MTVVTDNDQNGEIRRVILKSKDERRLLRGHLWAYRNELARPPHCEDGDIVDLVSDRGRFIGRGYFQSEGGIAVRVLTHHQTDIDNRFFRERIDEASALRTRLFPGQTTYRWVHGESDALPGLVVDRYGNVAVVQSTSAFYAKHFNALAKALRAQDGIETVRLTVGDQRLSAGAGATTAHATIGSAKFELDLESSQKTGLFLDQRENALAASRYCKDAEVLDAFCYAGMWSCLAGLAGAARVHGVDTSAAAIEAARKNAELNGLTDRCTFECLDAADALKRQNTYDVVLLDPPAFAKSRTHATKALSRYQAINKQAMTRVNPRGFLITSSCSHFVGMEMFLETLKRASRGVHREIRILETRGAAPDHPQLLAMPETAYLKCVVLQVI